MRKKRKKFNYWIGIKYFLICGFLYKSFRLYFSSRIDKQIQLTKHLSLILLFEHNNLNSNASKTLLTAVKSSEYTLTQNVALTRHTSVPYKK